MNYIPRTYHTEEMWSSTAWRRFASTFRAGLVLHENPPITEKEVPGKRFGFRTDLRTNGSSIAHWIQRGIDSLAAQSGHPELQYAPVLWWGFSRQGLIGTTWAEIFPERTLGVVRYMCHLRDDTFDYTNRLARVPIYAPIGEQDHIAKMNNIEFLRQGRKHGNPYTTTVIFGANHGEGYNDRRSLDWFFPWVSVLLSQLPGIGASVSLLEGGLSDASSPYIVPYTSPPHLRRFNSTHRGWLGNMDKIIERKYLDDGKDTHKGSLEGNVFHISPINEFKGNSSSASWIPGMGMATLWKELNENRKPRKSIVGVMQTKKGSVTVFRLVSSLLDMPLTVLVSIKGHEDVHEVVIAGHHFGVDLTPRLVTGTGGCVWVVVQPARAYGVAEAFPMALACPRNESVPVVGPSIHVSLRPEREHSKPVESAPVGSENTIQINESEDSRIPEEDIVLLDDTSLTGDGSGAMVGSLFTFTAFFLVYFTICRRRTGPGTSAPGLP